MLTNEHISSASAPVGAGFVFLATSSSVEETRHIGQALGQAAHPGTVIALEGDLGAGKTHFTQGVAQGLGIHAEVTSPTFNLLVSYDKGRLPLFHFDLYRLEERAQLEDLGYYDVLDQDGVCCIEWSERFPETLPEDVLVVRLTRNEDDTRSVSVLAKGQDSEACLRRWSQLLEGVSAEELVTKPAKTVVQEEGAAAACPGADSLSVLPDRCEGGPRNFVLALDTSNEIIALGLGELDRESRRITFVSHCQTPAFRASNTKLISRVEALLAEAGIASSQVASVICGRGPGSFTGVRICLATAKGLAMGLGASLYGVSTLDAQAWEAHARGYRGQLVVVGDAMRKEVYPVSFDVLDSGPERLNPDKVCKAACAAQELGTGASERLITGDALHKYAEPFEACGVFAPESDWMPTGRGLLLCAQALWDEGSFDPDDRSLGNPLTLLPVYTRLSDAEEHERQRFAKPAPVDLVTGVQGEGPASSEAGEQTCGKSLEGSDGAVAVETLRYQPLEAVWCQEVARLESQVMGSDAWRASQVADDLSQADRSWWACFACSEPDARVVTRDNAQLVGYAGGWIVDGQLQILKVASDPALRRRGIARNLLAHLADDARDLGATEATLEVRASNVGAHAFYESLGMKKLGKRPRYYSDREDAFVFMGPLPHVGRDVAGMNLLVNEGAQAQAAQASGSVIGGGTLPDTLILAIESSCDETAVAIVDGDGSIVADVVASQIDFHSRFGGVVPEIASRKHIEAIGGVVQECMDQARATLGVPELSYSQLSAIGVTYAPGLLGALVVGVAFAKGLAWSAGVPLVGVNHLEGHLYANKMARPDITPPMVVSLVSGGHTMLVHVKDWGCYETLGSTLDDAVGEAFDKVAKAMGLGYPGGPLITKLASTGDPRAIRFPRAMLHSGDYSFSLSGLKTAVMTYLQKEERAGHVVNQHDVAASFQAAVVDVQVAKAKTALEQTGAKEFCLGGGVAANPVLRAGYEEMCAKMGVRLTLPPLKACTDNASMIALVALERFRQGKFMGMDADAQAHVSLDEPY